MTSISIKDIAKMAGVSVATVSLALNGKKGVSDSKRAMILEIARQTKYIPNSNARGLIKNSTNNIAVLLRQDLQTIDRLFYMELIDSILTFNKDTNYNLVFTSYSEQNTSIHLPDIIRAREALGILVLGDIPQPVLNELLKYQLPIVFLDVTSEYPYCSTVRMDYQKAAYYATKHLLKLGHTDIAYIGNDCLENFNRLTFDGFRKAMNGIQAAISINRIQFNAHDVDSLNMCLEEAVKGSAPPTAIFCATDIYACYAIRYLQGRGFHVPEDTSVIGIDNSIISEFTSPSLTTVKVDRTKMGSYGYKQLLDIVRGEEHQDIILPSNELILRGSTGPKSVQ